MIYEIFPSVQSSFTCTLKPPEMAVNDNKFVFWTSSVEPVWRTVVDLYYGRLNNRLRLTFTWSQTAYVEETWMPVHTECCQKETSAVWLLNMYFRGTTVLCFFIFVCVVCCYVHPGCHKIKEVFSNEMEGGTWRFYFCHAWLAGQRWSRH